MRGTARVIVPGEDGSLSVLGRFPGSTSTSARKQTISTDASAMTPEDAVVPDGMQKPATTPRRNQNRKNRGRRDGGAVKPDCQGSELRSIAFGAACSVDEPPEDSSAAEVESAMPACEITTYRGCLFTGLRAAQSR